MILFSLFFPHASQPEVIFKTSEYLVSTKSKKEENIIFIFHYSSNEKHQHKQLKTTAIYWFEIEFILICKKACDLNSLCEENILRWHIRN